MEQGDQAAKRHLPYVYLCILNIRFCAQLGDWKAEKVQTAYFARLRLQKHCTCFVFSQRGLEFTARGCFVATGLNESLVEPAL